MLDLKGNKSPLFLFPHTNSGVIIWGEEEYRKGKFQESCNLWKQATVTIVLIFIKITLKAVRWWENTVKVNAVFSADGVNLCVPSFKILEPFLNRTDKLDQYLLVFDGVWKTEKGNSLCLQQKGWNSSMNLKIVRSLQRFACFDCAIGTMHARSVFSSGDFKFYKLAVTEWPTG